MERDSKKAAPTVRRRSKIEPPQPGSEGSLGQELDWLSTMYRDNKEYARFHEDQRQKSAQLIVVTSLGIVSIITAFKADFRTIPLAIILIYLARFGRIMALKQYERVGRNTAIAHAIRRQVANITKSGGAAVEQAYVDGEKEHRENIAPLSAKSGTNLVSLALEEHWAGLYKFISVIGLVALIFGLSSGAYEICSRLGCDFGALGC